MKRSAKRTRPHKVEAPLDPDVLWMIFSLNTLSDEAFTAGDDDYDITTDRSLITARFTSQVCRLWRSVMLSSPEIWANSLNLKYLEQKDDKWRNEVIRRTGTSHLSIIARDVKKDSFARRLLFSLLEKEAGRIRRIHTSTAGLYRDDLHESAWTKLFLQEAPNLEIISFRQYQGLNTRLSKVFLFQNKPTKIHTFIIQGFAFYATGPWNESIRRLEILQGCIVGSLVPALSSMPKLESLHIDESEILEDSEHGIPFTLPNTQQFFFKNDLKSAAAILNLIPPTGVLTSRITLMPGGNYPLSTDLTARLHPALVQHIQASFSKELLLDISDFRMILTNKLPLLSIDPTEFPFYICVYMADVISCLLLDTISTCFTNTITHLDLCLEHLSSFSSSGREAFRASITNLVASLDAVEVLHTAINDMVILTRLLHTETICFTRLHTLVLKPHTRPVSMVLVAFLEKRRNVGFPLSKLEITGSPNIHKKVLQYLRQSNLTFVLTDPASLGENGKIRRQ